MPRLAPDWARTRARSAPSAVLRGLLIGAFPAFDRWLGYLALVPGFLRVGWPGAGVVRATGGQPA